MEDKYLESILDEIRDAVKLIMMRYGHTKDTGYLDVGIELIEKCIKSMQEGDKKSDSITECYQTLRGMMDEMIDEKDRNIESSKAVVTEKIVG